MDKIQHEKDRLRNEMAATKQKHTSEELSVLSQEVLLTLEMTGVFADAKNVLIYHSIADEVQTIEFIEKWKSEKEFYLPVVVNDGLVFRKYVSDGSFNEASFGIFEPVGENLSDFRQVDLIVVPGVAFDRNKNRMGRGKGYYDRFLQTVSAPKLGICFQFQLLDHIPFDDNDVKMDYIVSENDFIW